MNKVEREPDPCQDHLRILHWHSSQWACLFTEAKLTRIPFLTAVCVSDEWLTQITVGHACKRMGLCYRITGASSTVV